LQKLKLNQSAFVIISVIGQELLAAGHYSAAVSMLEAALQIGTCSLKLRGSVFSALSSAYWGLGSIDTAISYMQHDLSVAKSLGRYLLAEKHGKSMQFIQFEQVQAKESKFYECHILLQGTSSFYI
jgi:hypothetical protein